METTIMEEMSRVGGNQHGCHHRNYTFTLFLGTLLTHQSIDLLNSTKKSKCKNSPTLFIPNLALTSCSFELRVAHHSLYSS